LRSVISYFTPMVRPSHPSPPPVFHPSRFIHCFGGGSSRPRLHPYPLFSSLLLYCSLPPLSASRLFPQPPSPHPLHPNYSSILHLSLPPLPLPSLPPPRSSSPPLHPPYPRHLPSHRASSSAPPHYPFLPIPPCPFTPPFHTLSLFPPIIRYFQPLLQSLFLSSSLDTLSPFPHFFSSYSIYLFPFRTCISGHPLLKVPSLI